MRFTLQKPVLTKDGKDNTWIEAGTYHVIRMFDKDRVIIEVGAHEHERQITLVRMYAGQLESE